MLHIKYKLASSGIHGVGLFSDEDIAKGSLIYTANPLLDTNITQAEFDALNNSEKAEIRWWGFFDKPSSMWHVDFDVTKFINHSYKANVTQNLEHNEAFLVAARDIKKGEELTQNYLEFELKEDLAKRGIA